MNAIFSEESYEDMLGKLFVRFPSFQKTGAGAYKPGIGNMEFFDSLAGHPHKHHPQQQSGLCPTRQWQSPDFDTGLPGAETCRKTDRPQKGGIGNGSR